MSAISVLVCDGLGFEVSELRGKGELENVWLALCVCVCLGVRVEGEESEYKGTEVAFGSSQVFEHGAEDI